MQQVVARLLSVVLPAAAALGVFSTVPAGQLEHGAEAATLRQVVIGRVFMPDGSPSVGALVVTSAGGQAVTGADGSFTLAVELPLDTESLEVTAVADERAGSGSLVADARFVPGALSPTTSVGQLAMMLSPDCRPRWLPTFGVKPGTNGAVGAFAVFDDGGGPALYVGAESYQLPDGTPGADVVVKWDGSKWSALPALAVGFLNFNPTVRALAVFDDGSGRALYAGGSLQEFGGVGANGIARWDGSSWSALGSGVSDYTDVYSLAVFDDGSGPALYAGGDFTSAGGVTANSIAKWDGSSWSALGTGMSGGVNHPSVNALAVFDDGSGPALYAGGDFTSAGGVTASRIAKWDGSSWAPLRDGLHGGVTALAVFDDGSGPALVAGGNFTWTGGGLMVNGVANWDGERWRKLGTGMNSSVRVLTVYDDGSGPVLCAGGEFTTSGGRPASRIAKWDGSSWSPLGTGMNSTVHALAVFDDGSGPVLHAGGAFTTAGGVPVSYIARWDRATWSAIGSGMNDVVSALEVYDDGGGPALYAGGYFGTAGGVTANRIAKWDGTRWSRLGLGVDAFFLRGIPGVLALAVYDDGSGPALYAGGDFNEVYTANGSAAINIARWDGTSWSTLGSGIGNLQYAVKTVRALTVYDDGSGPALYAGGNFTTAGGASANHVAKWDGSSWSPLGSGIDGSVFALTVYDDGSGSALYAGGDFTLAGGTTAHHIARWDGSNWSALGNGMNGWVSALTVSEVGGSRALYAGGRFTRANGIVARRISRWNGSTWSGLGDGLEYIVRALTTWDAGDAQTLYAGGEFYSSPADDSYLAKWGCRTRPTAMRR